MGFSLNRSFGRTVPSFPKEETEEREEVVEISHFAAMCGLTRREYLSRMFRLLEKGKAAWLLKEVAQEDFLDWAAGRIEEGDEKALLCFRLSLNRKRDIGLFCVLDLGETRAFPDIAIEKIVPGFCGRPPLGLEKLSGFEVSFCDLETALVGEEKCQTTSQK